MGLYRSGLILFHIGKTPLYDCCATEQTPGPLLHSYNYIPGTPSRPHPTPHFFQQTHEPKMVVPPNFSAHPSLFLCSNSRPISFHQIDVYSMYLWYGT
jgi:hypothetical protein